MSRRTDSPRSVAVVTLGCARNEVDSEELAGRLAAHGWTLAADARDADVAVVNTCGFIEQAKKDSVDALLEAADLKGQGRTRAVVAVGCLAERYGRELAAELPEADAVLGFDAYADLSAHLTAILAGEHVPSHVPADRRRLLPLAPAARVGATGGGDGVAVPGHGVSGLLDAPGEVTRTLLEDRPWAPLKIASGCDRRCTFCAIPSFRGSFVSRRPADILAEARWLAAQGTREVLLVSENTTSYGKDLGDLRLLESLLPELAAVPGLDWVRLSYLQPAEIRPGFFETVLGVPGVVPYLDMSFQHAAGSVLRRMRRFGSGADFLRLLAAARAVDPRVGVRANVIVGFPGESEAELRELEDFLTEARLDVVGVFGYSDEEGTEALGHDGKLPAELVEERTARVRALVEELTAQRAEDRIGERWDVLVESVESLEGADSPRGVGADEDPAAVAGRPGAAVLVTGRCGSQGPDVDGSCRFTVPVGVRPAAVGDLIPVRVTGTDGVDLLVEPLIASS